MNKTAALVVIEPPHHPRLRSESRRNDRITSSGSHQSLSQQNLPCVDGSELARVFFTFAGWSVQPCVRPVSAAHRPLAIMPSADQVPVKSPHSTMHWHMWVVLIAGSTGSALRAVRPPNLHITPMAGAISFTPPVRRVPCSARLWPSSPKPSSRSYWRVRSRRPSLAAAPTML